MCFLLASNVKINQNLCMISNPVSVIKGIFSRNSRSRKVPKNQIILYKDSPASEVFVVKSGLIKLYTINDKGDEKVLRLVSEGAVLPLISPDTASNDLEYFAETLEDSDLEVTPMSDFLEDYKTNKALAETVLRRSLRATKELHRRIAGLSSSSSYLMVASALMHISKVAAKRQSKDWRVVDSDAVTHELIAKMTGLTRSTVSIQIKSLREKGAITMKRGKLAINEAVLKKQLDT